MDYKPEIGLTKKNPPAKKDLIIVKLMIWIGVGAIGVFIFWFYNSEHIGYAPFYYLLAVSFGYKIIRILYEWYCYYDPSVTPQPELKTQFTADILTTFCAGEPYEMIISTLKAMVKVKYPHENYLCDESDDPYIKQVCKELGVHHVTRTEKLNAKAGNINNALKKYATGDICLILDPDHVPHPDFLHEVLPYFENNEVGFVQVVQSYYNQNDTIIAKAAAEQTYHFYGPMMMTMNTYGSAQAIGANCTFRRKALDSIGGHAAGLSEDMHTAMQLHAKGWKSVYHPAVVSKGLVPSNLSSYFKQQLKWSRGTFDLLFYVYPKLFKNFSNRQRIYYLFAPLFFLYGVIIMIDLLVPALSLIYSKSPFKMDFLDFVIFMLPAFLISLIIRQYVQRWLYDRSERGIHLLGGALLTTTWWIAALGFVLTIFKIKVPYIPTPKGNEPENALKINIPNLLVIFFLIFSIIYGLTRDLNPYNLFMASFAAINLAILSFGILIGQQKLINWLHKIFSNTFISKGSKTRVAIWEIRNEIYNGIRYSAPFFVVFIVILSLTLYYVKELRPADLSTIVAPDYKNTGGFYYGNKVDNAQINLKPGKLFQHELYHVSLVDIDPAEHKLPSFEKDDIISKFPYLRISLSEETLQKHDLFDVFCQIQDRKLIGELEDYRQLIKSHNAPVFIELHLLEEKAFNNLDPLEYFQTFHSVMEYFKLEGVHKHIVWVWSPYDFFLGKQFYPGNDFTKWLGLNAKDLFINGTIVNDSLLEFQSSYKLPIICYDFENEMAKSVNLKRLAEKYKIRGFIRKLPDNEEVDASAIFSKTIIDTIPHYESKFFKKNNGKFLFYVNDKPFYIKGIAYNTAHDWRDGNFPLTRQQVYQDLSEIKALGANTIRRYAPSLYDRNILKVASELDMKIFYGFWFDPKVDYLKNTDQVESYENEVLNKIKKLKGEKSIIAWGIGNETWGLLKQAYHKPYLNLVRDKYLEMINRLAKKIKEVDPDRPVLTVLEHTIDEFDVDLSEHYLKTSFLDAIGINSYYEENISKLNELVTRYYPDRPYLVSEFGPKGYWLPELSDILDDSLLIEQSSHEKAKLYKKEWTQYIEKNRGSNFGGIAYSWRDRLEGTATWYGLTDYKTRKKPAYYALHQIWKGPINYPIPDYVIIPPPYDLSPGKSYTFRAITLSEIPSSEYHFEWYVLKDQFLKEINSVIDIKGNSALVKMPKEPGFYRLYVHVTDKKRNVVTHSFQLRINFSRND